MHRRDAMTGLMAGALLSALPLCARAALSRDDSYDIEGAMRQVLGERKAMPGRITLDAPKLAGSGNSVPLTVRVDSPMSAAEYVRRIHVFATRNPRPHVMSVQLNPHSGRAEFSTHIRLSGTQAVAVFAEMSDTTLWSAEALIDVTVGACESLMFRF